MTADQRLLLVHAHPDDESIGQGATMARYVAEGRGVTLVTCTAGEMGEILVPELEHLAADHDDGLGEHRRSELDDAMKELGVTDHRFLGGFGTYRDSGMKWHEDGHAVAADDVHENAFWHADLTEAADHLVEVIREVRPQVLVTYDQFGGYGHPDHIQAHRVAMYAAQLAAVPSYRRDLGEPWDIAKIYWGAMSESRMRAGLRALRDAGDTTTFEGMDPDGDAAALRDRRRGPRRGRRRRRVRRPQDGRAAPRTPPRSPPTGRSSRCRTTSATGCGRPSSTGSPRAPPVSRARTVWRPTCSPDSDASAGGRSSCSVLGVGTGLASVALHEFWWGLLLSVVATVGDPRLAAPGLVVAAAVRARLGRSRGLGRQPAPRGGLRDPAGPSGLRAARGRRAGAGVRGRDPAPPGRPGSAVRADAASAP